MGAFVLGLARLGSRANRKKSVLDENQSSEQRMEQLM
jgi:hypothetical protein